MTPAMRTPLCLATAFLCTSTLPEEVVYAPAEGLTLVRSFDSRASYALDELLIEIDGEEVPHGDAPELEIVSNEHIVVTDELLGVEGGRPTRLRRTFDELARDVLYKSSGAGDGEDELQEHSVCDLEGAAVLFRWNEDDQAYEVEAGEGHSIDQDVLDDLIEDMDLRQLLPGHAVEPGDEWDLDPDAYARLMWPGGFLRFYEEEGEFDAEAAQGDQELVDNMEGVGKAVFVELRDEGGVEVAVLEVRFEVSSSNSRTIEGPAENEAERTLNMRRDVEGTLLWAVEAGHLLSATLEAQAELEVVEAGTVQSPDGEEADLRQTRSFSGTIEYTLSVESRG